MEEIITARTFELKDYSLALLHKEETGGILRKILHPNPNIGSFYEVRYLPPDRSPYRDLD